MLNIQFVPNCCCYFRLMSFKDQQWAYMLFNCLNQCHIKDSEGLVMINWSTYLRTTDVWLYLVQKILPAQTLILAFTVCFQSGSAETYYHIQKGPEWAVTRDH